MISYLTKTIKCNIFVLYLDKFYISRVIHIEKLALLKSRLKKINFTTINNKNLQMIKVSDTAKKKIIDLMKDDGFDAAKD